jgi:hypothetical protein
MKNFEEFFFSLAHLISSSRHTTNALYLSESFIMATNDYFGDDEEWDNIDPAELDRAVREAEAK